MGRTAARRTPDDLLRGSPAAGQPRALTEWLERHERECVEHVETWMIRSLPVPTGVVVECWPDPAWRRALENIVAGPAPAGRLDPDRTGLLRAADRERGAGIVTPDGETVWAREPSLLVPHPVLLDDLEDLRELVTELQVEQAVPQLHRETWARAEPDDPGADRVARFSGGRFAQLAGAVRRCRALGYAVGGGCAVARIWEDGRLVEARLALGGHVPEGEATTGELTWVAGGRRLPLAQVG